MPQHETITIEAEPEEVPSTALVTTAQEDIAASGLNPADFQALLMPALTVDESIKRFELFGELVTKLLKEGKDYGQIPGTDDNSLLLPGAEKIGIFFGLQIRVNLQESERDRQAEFPWFYYRYKATAYRGNQLLVECEGSCNNYEDAYRYVWVDAEYPGKEFESQIVNGKPGRWWGVWENGVQVQKWQERREHPNPFGLINNIEKKAQKRAYVGVIDKATGASGYFSKKTLGGKKDRKAGANAGNGQNAPATADGPTQFWLKGRASGIQQQDLQEIANRVEKGSITWQQALAELPQS